MFAAPDRVLAIALTPLVEDNYPAGDVVDLTEPSRTVLALEASISVEADVSGETLPGGGRDLRPGQLVDAQEGMCLAVNYGRHQPSMMGGVATVGVSDWTGWQRETPRTVFKRWRLKLEIGSPKPILWEPVFP
jgi:hypothetical protein